MKTRSSSKSSKELRRLRHPTRKLISRARWMRYLLTEKKNHLGRNEILGWFSSSSHATYRVVNQHIDLHSTYSSRRKTRGQWPYRRAGNKFNELWSKLSLLDLSDLDNVCSHVSLASKCHNLQNVGTYSGRPRQPRRSILTSEFKSATLNTYVSMSVWLLYASVNINFTKVKHRTSSFIPRILPEWAIDELGASASPLVKIEVRVESGFEIELTWANL